MSLLNKRSLYDRHQRGALGNPLGTPAEPGTTPSEGNYYMDYPGIPSTGEPFIENPGTSQSPPLKDHMVRMLTETIQSKNSAQVYNPSNLDLDGGTDHHSGATFFDGWTVPEGTYGTSLKQFGGPYTTTGPTDGYY